ncbi:sufE-like protein 2, chloroplastic isoform X2 [Jatropha curcas]|uniref:sufE-like protein 2, chloroplastic isoform X2 n=1 Tax=Jatropha curcas TaxID=180498 RepID=UPI001893A24B|nr:sufE-like protein 2, chloroplastic isoform X2 [Jatropha curcas]
MTSATFKIVLNFFPFPNHNNSNPNKSCKMKSSLLCNHKYSSILNLNPSILKLNSRRNDLSVSSFADTEKPVGFTNAKDRLQRLVSEFRSLTEPIDRVKRLLDYAARLPPFDESARSPGNRVMGCTTQVWLEAKMDEKGRMRFRADSDSEITKGFISCLISLLDGAEPDEVVAVKAEDLAALNVGLYGKAQSRVNTWHNVLISMQSRTEALAAERNEKCPVEPLPSLVVNVDGISAQFFEVLKFLQL